MSKSLTGAISKKISSMPPHIQAGILAYRDALNSRKDWHAAIAAAIDAADKARAEMDQ